MIKWRYEVRFNRGGFPYAYPWDQLFYAYKELQSVRTTWPDATNIRIVAIYSL